MCQAVVSSVSRAESWSGGRHGRAGARRTPVRMCELVSPSALGTDGGEDEDRSFSKEVPWQSLINI